MPGVSELAAHDISPLATHAAVCFGEIIFADDFLVLDANIIWEADTCSIWR